MKKIEKKSEDLRPIPGSTTTRLSDMGLFDVDGPLATSSL